MINTQTQKLFVALEPGALINNASAAPAEIDTYGFDYLDVYVILGATDIALTALKLQSTDTTGAGYADVQDLQHNGTYVNVADFSVNPATLPTSTSDNGVFAWHVDLLGRQRFFKPVVTVGNGTSGAYLTIVAVLSRAKTAPSDVTGRGLTEELFV